MASAIWGLGVRSNWTNVIHWNLWTRGSMACNGTTDVYGRRNDWRRRGTCGGTKSHWTTGREYDEHERGQLQPDGDVSGVPIKATGIPGHLSAGGLHRESLCCEGTTSDQSTVSDIFPQMRQERVRAFLRKRAIVGNALNGLSVLTLCVIVVWAARRLSTKWGEQMFNDCMMLLLMNGTNGSMKRWAVVYQAGPTIRSSLRMCRLESLCDMGRINRFVGKMKKHGARNRIIGIGSIAIETCARWQWPLQLMYSEYVWVFRWHMLIYVFKIHWGVRMERDTRGWHIGSTWQRALWSSGSGRTGACRAEGATSLEWWRTGKQDLRWSRDSCSPSRGNCGRKPSVQRNAFRSTDTASIVSTRRCWGGRWGHGRPTHDSARAVSHGRSKNDRTFPGTWIDDTIPEQNASTQ